MADWPFVGREGEIEQIETALARGRGVLLAGPAGVGKTRLLEAVLERATARGTTALNVVGSRASASIPLGCLSSLLATAGDAPPDAAGLVLVRQALEAAGAGRSIVLAIDDAHWLDDPSAALVHQLVAGKDALVIASVREGEEVPPEVTALWKDGLLERIDIAPLGTEAMVAMLEAVLGGQVERAGALRLGERCRGNALFLRELLDEAKRLGLVELQHGVWTIGDPPARSARLAELVAERIGNLDESALNALELVALGEPIGIDELDRLASMAAVEELERRGLIRLVVDGRRQQVRLDHPVHGDVVRAQLPELRRRRLLAALADDLEQHGARRRGDPLRMTLLRLDAGGDADPALLVAGAWEAYLASAGPTAERLARAAFDTARTFDTAQLLARVLFEEGKYEEQQDVWIEAGPLAKTEVERALVAVGQAGGYFWGLGDLDRARQILIDAEREFDPASSAFWDVRATRAHHESQAGLQRDAIELLAGCPPLSRLGPRSLAQVALTYAFALPAVGSGEDALAVIDMAIQRRAEDTEFITIYVVSLLNAAKATACVNIGRLAEARDIATRGYEAALRGGERTTQAYFANTLGWVELHSGQLAEANRYYREGTALFRAHKHVGPARWALGGLLFAAGLARDRDVATEAERALDDFGPHPAGLFDVPFRRARAWAALANDDPARARAELAAAIELARERQLPAEEAACLHDSVRLGEAQEVVDRLVELAESCDGELIPAMAAHAMGLAKGDVDMLDEVATRFADMGFLLKAAEAAMGAAEAAARAGDQQRATRLSNRATEMAARCETPATPMLTSPQMPVPLTNREREIAILAASGLTSRLISERLFLSTRTVDNHLARIYTKLGISGRQELADALNA
jgi:DNA-binding CsgD family transcriptional regulator